MIDDEKDESYQILLKEQGDHTWAMGRNIWPSGVPVLEDGAVDAIGVDNLVPFFCHHSAFIKYTTAIILI